MEWSQCWEENILKNKQIGYNNKIKNIKVFINCILNNSVIILHNQSTIIITINKITSTYKRQMYEMPLVSECPIKHICCSLLICHNEIGLVKNLNTNLIIFVRLSIYKTYYSLLILVVA